MLRKILSSVFAGALMVSPVVAAEMGVVPPPQQDDIERGVNAQWGAMQVMQSNFGQVVVGLMNDRRALMAERDRLTTKLAETEKLCGEKCGAPEQAKPARAPKSSKAAEPAKPADPSP